MLSEPKKDKTNWFEDTIKNSNPNQQYFYIAYKYLKIGILLEPDLGNYQFHTKNSIKMMHIV